MIFEATRLPGLLLVRPQKHSDERGHFTRLWGTQEFAAAGVRFAPSQISASFNHRAGTLRGLHWQAPPHAETKLVWVSRGAVWDVAVDLRPDSPTRLRWFATELHPGAAPAVLIPPGFAHGFITLADNTELHYCIDPPYAPQAARGARYNDPAFAISWPLAPQIVAERDLAWPDFA